MITVLLIGLGCVVLFTSHAYAYGSGRGRAMKEADFYWRERWRYLIGSNGSRWVSVDGHLERLP